MKTFQSIITVVFIGVFIILCSDYVKYRSGLKSEMVTITDTIRTIEFVYDTIELLPEADIIFTETNEQIYFYDSIVYLKDSSKVEFEISSLAPVLDYKFNIQAPRITEYRVNRIPRKEIYIQGAISPLSYSISVLRRREKFIYGAGLIYDFHTKKYYPEISLSYRLCTK